jgi:hypothetical protein
LSLESLSSLVKYLQVRPEADPRVEHLKGGSLKWTPALIKNIRPGWKGSPGKNTLAYFVNLQIKTVKSFIVQALDVNVLCITEALKLLR